MEHSVNPETETSETIVEGIAREPALPPGKCLIDGAIDPCTIVIVGASGDLTARKLMPALYNLYLNGGLPEPFLIVGCSRTKMSSEAFRDRMEKAVRGGGQGDRSRWPPWCRP